jgi:hypothetical protein
MQTQLVLSMLSHFNLLPHTTSRAAIASLSVDNARRPSICWLPFFNPLHGMLYISAGYLVVLSYPLQKLKEK